MKTVEIREKLHSLIDSIDDKKAEAIYTLLTEDLDADTIRKKLIQQERDSYAKGEGNSYTWNNVKEMALNKDKRHVL